MRTLLTALVALWIGLTAIAYALVLPSASREEEMARAYLGLAPAGEGPASAALRGYLDAQSGGADDWKAFRDWYNRTQPTPLAAAPRLIWSTDDNPARRTQCRLFRAWHLRTYGTPVDIATDPSNRDTTKTIVQCVAGAGPDVIEAYGPAQLSQFIDAGVALDLTDLALARGFGPSEVFPAAVSSMCRDGRQYAFPCNVGYTVLFYHRDLFEAAGATPPPEKGGWTFEQMVRAAERVTGRSTDSARPESVAPVGIMGLGAWGMALADGARFFIRDGTASAFDSPETVAALQRYLDLMYRDRIMPTPAELASMASSGGATMNMGAEAASASALFAAKACAMISDGRWSYVTFAKRQLDRVIAPAVRRRIEALEGAERAATEFSGESAAARERELLQAALDSLSSDVLVPISEEQYRLVEGCLTEADRRNLLHVGVAHVPTSSGTPWYEAAARVAIVNRASPRAALAARFIEFLASEEYNNQINYTFDSISGTPRIIERNGIAGPPRALPGLEAFDSPVFVEAMASYAHEWELSSFIGRARLGQLVGPILEQVTNNALGAAEAARLIEERINAQIHANLARDAALRAEWEKRAGRTFDPSRPLREQAGESPRKLGDTETGEGAGQSERTGAAATALPRASAKSEFSEFRFFSPCLGASVVNAFGVAA
jgi:ABC-type glycerol-3-phosphate transport system substrate-binding protein